MTEVPLGRGRNRATGPHDFPWGQRRSSDVDVKCNEVLEQLSDYVDAEGEAGNNQNALSVYGRQGEACPRCGHVIRRLVQGARSTFYCPACQR